MKVFIRGHAEPVEADQPVPPRSPFSLVVADTPVTSAHSITRGDSTSAPGTLTAFDAVSSRSGDRLVRADECTSAARSGGKRRHRDPGPGCDAGRPRRVGRHRRGWRHRARLGQPLLRCRWTVRPTQTTAGSSCPPRRTNTARVMRPPTTLLLTSLPASFRRTGSGSEPAAYDLSPTSRSPLTSHSEASAALQFSR